MRLFIGLAASIGLVFVLSSSDAMAQYKNTSFGLDAGYWLIVKPPLPDDATQNPNHRPIRLSNGARFGGETNFKMDQDRWWFTGRVNLGVLQFSDGEEFDRQAKEALGTLLGIQGSIGVRYYLMTDRVRPYLQGSLSYLRLLSFADSAGENCSGGDLTFCTTGSSASNYLPHPNVGGVHLQPGFEIIVSRDITLHIFADIQRWLVFSAADNTAVVIGAGFNFFT